MVKEKGGTRKTKAEEEKRPKVAAAAGGESNQSSSEAKSGNNNGATPRHLQKLQAKDVAAEDEKSPVDFFGRALDPELVARRRREEAESGKNSEIVSSDIWFKFKEGYNNAVRRNVRMKDLL